METSCLFCNIANEKMSTELLYKNENLVVFKDIKPHAPVHLLIVPKQHIRSINDLTAADLPLVSEMIMAAKNMAIEARCQGIGLQASFQCRARRRPADLSPSSALDWRMDSIGDAT